MSATNVITFKELEDKEMPNLSNVVYVLINDSDSRDFIETIERIIKSKRSVKKANEALKEMLESKK